MLISRQRRKYLEKLQSLFLFLFFLQVFSTIVFFYCTECEIYDSSLKYSHWACCSETVLQIKVVLLSEFFLKMCLDVWVTLDLHASISCRSIIATADCFSCKHQKWLQD